jgi:dTDP-4-amino-4,6-dideoxygalactose transaminase
MCDRLGERHIGTFGDIAIFSLQINKVITAGEGGMISTNDDHLSRRIFAAHDLGAMHGTTRATFSRRPTTSAIRYGVPGHG